MNNVMVIKYENTESFYDGIKEMVMRGLQFEADFHTLSIALSGGY